jgi:hypothetical protein
LCPRPQDLSRHHLSPHHRVINIMARKAKKNRWEYSKAKALLARDIADNVVTPDMMPLQVFYMREEYWEWDYKHNTRLFLATARENGATRVIPTQPFHDLDI